MMNVSSPTGAAARLPDFKAPWTVKGLPEGFDQTDIRFQAARMKWNMDRDGQDWPNPRYFPQAGGGYMIIAENVFDHGDGPHTWGMEVSPRTLA